MRGLTAAEQELLRLWEQRGALSAEIVVEAAEPPASVLHSSFEWDDGEAARRYRLSQAGDLIRSVKLRVVQQDPDGTVNDFTVRAWTSAARAEIPDAAPGSYVPTQGLDGKARTVLLQRMQRELQQLRRRYSGLAEFWAQLDQLAQEGRGQAS